MHRNNKKKIMRRIKKNNISVIYKCHNGNNMAEHQETGT